MNMRYKIVIILMMCGIGLSAQWIDPWQIRPAPDSNMILGAKGVYNDADWVYIDSLGLAQVDSIFLRNDTIFLTDGNGFVKIPKQGNVKGNGVATRVAWWAGTDSLSSDAALYWDNTNKRLGINNVSPQYAIDINGTLRVATRTGTAATGAGFTADGQLVAYSLDTGATSPNTYINSGMYINVTGDGTMGDPYVINNTGVSVVTASSPLSSSGGTTPNITIQNGSGSQSGAITSTDWNTFNNKFNLPALSIGSVLFSNGSTIAQDNSNFYWDDINNNLGIGTIPNTGAKLHVSNGDIWIIGGSNRRFLMGSSVSDGFWGGMQWNTSNRLTINHSGFVAGSGVVAMMTSDGFTGLRTLGTAPLTPLDIFSSNTSDNGTYQNWAYSASPTLYNLLLKQTVTGGNVRYNFSQVNAGTSYNNVLVFDQGNLGIGVTDATRKVDINGEVRIRDLTTTTPTRLVSADADGVMSSLTIGTGLSISGGALNGSNIYTADGTLTGNRTVTLSTNSLTIGSETSSNSFLTMTNGSGMRLKYNNNSALILNSTVAGIQTSGANVYANANTVQINTNGSGGTTGQFLKSDGAGQTVWALPYDGVIQQTGNSVTFTNGSAASIFSGATTGGGTTASGTTFTKSTTGAIYEIDLVIETFDSAIDNEIVTIELRQSGSYLTDSKFHADYTAGSDIEMSFKFLTNNSSGNLTFVNTTGVSFTGTVKRIIIKRVM